MLASPLQLLLVEDDTVDQVAVRRALAASKLEAELSVAVDAEAAAAALATRRFDCILLDYNLPRGSGMTVLEALRGAGDDTPVVVMTSHGDEELVVELMKNGATDYIAKQLLKPDRLAQSVRSALLLRDARRSAQAAQQALQEQLEFAELLVGIVSHDLRNPLQAISMSAALLERRGGLPAESDKAVTRIKSSSQRAVRLIRDLLDFTQARSGGGIPVAPAVGDLAALAQALVEEVSQAHPDRTLTLQAPAAVSAEFDADRMAQVLSNLLSNALDYATPGTAVTVQVQQQGGEALLAVHNQGPVIAAERMATLFEPMRQLHNESRRAGNIGLGLYIVKSIVQAHHGRVDVVSADGYTRFTVTVPLRQPARAQLPT